MALSSRISALLSISLVALLSCSNIKAADKTDNVKLLTQAQFAEQVFDYTKPASEYKFLGKRPAIIDFYAVWCGPCRKLSPTVDELANDYAGKIDFYKVDVDSAEELSKALGIRSIPMLLFIPVEGKPQSIVGLYPKSEIIKAINYMFYRTSK
ncbi:MAG: thioredoxin family protein [Muribaculaceae bacterium]